MDSGRRKKSDQQEGIVIAKEKGAFKGKSKKYHAQAKGKDRLIYNETIRLLEKGGTVMNIHRETGLSRNTIYGIKRELVVTQKEI